ncbi:zinc finger family protein [Trypanosoma rangeli]|uniref:Zinc finger family protein n=1 Tax=Trypanosoma rangeli TaxID=5698 RepID=A0A422N6N8_TRYRA|nr:zinc finger family protein [Trypanosoma rangeli]RNF01092.1 zinc finger family protein [Trypanosoma rangeli]|eukprot:RNF01092.1 zinc finger family protein [Trypanosoma rangeli]
MPWMGAVNSVSCMFSRLRCAVVAVGISCRCLHQATPSLFFPHVAGDWTCVCGFSNFASRAVCFQCHRAKSEPSLVGGEPPKFVDTKYNGLRRGDWVCACGAHNFAKREVCLSCETERKLSDRQREGSSSRLLPGDWICKKCNAHNFRARRECLRCGWKPIAVGPTGAASTGAGYTTGVMQSPWMCLACHAVNKKQVTSCEVCGSVREALAVSAPSAPMSLRPDDWHCGQCGFLNFSSRISCKNCRSPSAKEDGATDPSLWVCRCGYKNFRDRESCRDCGASRPAGP